MLHGDDKRFGGGGGLREGLVVSGGNLYFNVNKDTHLRWLRSQRRLIKKADERWPHARDAILMDNIEIVRRKELPSWY